jgi:pimeloyl-ACP methyl ester carboxylesterase
MVDDALAMRRGRGFRRVARSLRRYEFLGRGSAEAPPRVSWDANFAGAPTVPVTIAWGERDLILRPHQADRARARLPSASPVTLRGCGHLPMTDDPALVASTILATTGATH